MAGSGLAAPARILAAMFVLADGLRATRFPIGLTVPMIRRRRATGPARGHELLFGTFITPAAQRPQHAVELAVVADRVGLNLVTFQDHPYQPRLLDTGTLLTYVAARTSRVRLSQNVLNLPLQPPVIVARAAASADLLYGGRYELAIGAGRVWDAIEAMGGPRRTPGEAVEALSSPDLRLGPAKGGGT